MKPVDIFDIAEPHIQHQLVIGIGHGSFHAAASIVTANDHMFYFEMIHRIIQYCQQVYICMHYQVGHIAMNEDLSGLCVGDLIGRNTAVAAADPEEFRRLEFREPVEVLGVSFYLITSPYFIFIQ